MEQCGAGAFLVLMLKIVAVLHWNLKLVLKLMPPIVIALCHIDDVSIQVRSLPCVPSWNWEEPFGKS